MLVTSKDISNLTQKLKNEIIGDSSTVEHLINTYEKDFVFRTKTEGGNLSHLLITPKSTIELFEKQCNNVIIADCTYSTNIHKMPLLNFIGINNLNESFVLAFAFLKAEKFEDYQWALQELFSVVKKHPKVVVTDCEKAFLNALNSVLPDTKRMLCLWHIERHFNGYKTNENEVYFDEFFVDWKKIVNSKTEETLLLNVSEFETKWNIKDEEVPEEKVLLLNNLTSYVQKQWFPYFSYFVHFLTDNYPHLGNYTTQRAEGMHAVLKKKLELFKSDILVAVEAFKSTIDGMFREYIMKKDDQKMKIPFTMLANPLLSGKNSVAGKICLFALKKVEEMQVKIEQDPHEDGTCCTGQMRATMGYPCLHSLKINVALNLKIEVTDFIYQWWLQEPIIEDKVDCARNQAMELTEEEAEIIRMYRSLEAAGKTRFRDNLRVEGQTRVVDAMVPPTKRARKNEGSGEQKVERGKVVKKMRQCSTCGESGHDKRNCPKILR
ncbi:hypothetical protein RCL1_004701 [Eukaryota sp. TZLM3-RCL]